MKAIIVHTFSTSIFSLILTNARRGKNVCLKNGISLSKIVFPILRLSFILFTFSVAENYTYKNLKKKKKKKQLKSYT